MIIPKNALADWLKKVRYENAFFVFDYWMIVHFVSGMILGFFFQNPKGVLIALIAYEVLEYLLVDVMFLKETFKNALWDVIIGMVGFYAITNLGVSFLW